MANPTLAYYSASKFAVEGFTESFLKEMEPSWNIKGSVSTQAQAHSAPHSVADVQLD